MRLRVRAWAAQLATHLIAAFLVGAQVWQGLPAHIPVSQGNKKPPVEVVGNPSQEEIEAPGYQYR